jgi:hypothetical protein
MRKTSSRKSYYVDIVGVSCNRAKEPGFFAAAALNDTKKSHYESTHTSELFPVSFRASTSLYHQERVLPRVIQSGVCGAKNPGPCFIQSAAQARVTSRSLFRPSVRYGKRATLVVNNPSFRAASRHILLIRD